MAKLWSVAEAINAIKVGQPVIVVDDESRENEGDIILSAALATPETIAWTVNRSSGLLCAPMSNENADKLELPMMVKHNQDVRGTAYTVTVDAAAGITTGISAADRCHTLRVLADPNSTPADLNRPGHILPLRAVDGGICQRAGHTEAAVELMKLAELPEVGVIAEVVAKNGEMMRLPELSELAQREGVPLISIEQLLEYGGNRAAHQAARRSLTLHADTVIPTKYGDLRFMAYRDKRNNIDHLAITSPGKMSASPLVRVHSECLTGEALGSLKCECGDQLDAALKIISSEGGVVIYLRGQEGRGIGLTNKLRAYRLQEEGQDTVEANLSLGLPVDARDFGIAGEILRELNLAEIRLLSNNPDKLSQIEKSGIKVRELVPLVVGVNRVNSAYLTTKRDKLHHNLPETITTNEGE